MKTILGRAVVCLMAGSMSAASAATYKVVGWNDLGMHCMDGKDYSIYSILPPYNTFHAQVIDAKGKLIKSGGAVKLTYQAVADPTGSINKSTAGKTNFWSYAKLLFGASLAPDGGLAGYAMPGAANTPRAMTWDAGLKQFTATGVPISPYDDAGKKNYYPMMRLVAKSAAGATLASTDIVLPVSDEMDCSSCHKSGSPNTARPAAGWSFLPDPERDYKTNVLKLHDERQAASLVFKAALTKAGYSAAGLMASVNGGQPILCAKCHLSNALGGGMAEISPLTTALHKRHANVLDPTNNLALDSSSNREACYRCHPGSATKCLRGVMGKATAADGSMTMQCQSCHGKMSDVGRVGRLGWLDEPNCQGCHTGTAVKNNGQILYTTALENSGLPRVAVDNTFATTPNTPVAGVSLFRYSAGHGGLQCEACHGATHAEYPSSHANDNIQSIKLQGYAGTLVECGTCHNSAPQTVTGGPHGMHPVGAAWVSSHGDAAENNAAQCRTCHGLDYRGTVLSKTKTNRTFNVEDRSVSLKAGTAVGCYNCHNGPRGG